MSFHGMSNVYKHGIVTTKAAKRFVASGKNCIVKKLILARISRSGSKSRTESCPSFPTPFPLSLTLYILNRGEHQ